MTTNQIERAKNNKGIVIALYRVHWSKTFDRIYDGLQTKEAMRLCTQAALQAMFKIEVSVTWEEAKSIFVE